jgi:hypothetical protein
VFVAGAFQMQLEDLFYCSSKQCNVRLCSPSQEVCLLLLNNVMELKL